MELRKRPQCISDRNTPIWVVITGNIRSGREFKSILKQVFELKDAGLIDGICFCTWNEDLDGLPGLEDFLRSKDILIVAVDPPPSDPKIHPLFHGYVYYQRKSLHFALRALPTGTLVLKARTDFAEERFAAMTKAFFSCNDVCVRISEPVLQTRIFTYDARPDYFFYWDDIVFSGCREDLLNLNNSDLSPDLIYPNHIQSAECRLFTPLFLKSYPVLEWFFENIDGKKFAIVLARWAEHGGEVPSLALDILSSYFHILTRYLLLPICEDAPDREPRLTDFFSMQAEWGCVDFSTPWKSHKLVSQALLSVFTPGRVFNDPLLHCISMAMERMDAVPASRGMLPTDLNQAASALMRFGELFGEEFYKPQYRVNSPSFCASVAALEDFIFPEKRFPSWWAQKKFGAKKRLARWVLQDLL